MCRQEGQGGRSGQPPEGGSSLPKDGNNILPEDASSSLPKDGNNILQEDASSSPQEDASNIRLEDGNSSPPEDASSSPPGGRCARRRLASGAVLRQGGSSKAALEAQDVTEGAEAETEGAEAETDLTGRVKIKGGGMPPPHKYKYQGVLTWQISLTPLRYSRWRSR